MRPSELLRQKALTRASIIQKRRDNEKPVYNLNDRLITEQYNFIHSKARYKVARCSRRAGKSTGLSYYMREIAKSGKQWHCAYVGKTISVAKRTIWDSLKALVNECKDNVKIHESEHYIYFHDTQSYIWLFGANDSKQIEKMRGLYFKLAVVDEAQMFPSYLKTLIDEVIDPALGDLQGTLCLTGTPNASCSGVFYDADNSEGWESHYWTWLENKFFVDKAMSSNNQLTEPLDIMRESLKRRGVEQNDPIAQREWFGRWSKSDDLQVYKYTPEKQHYDSMPLGKWKYVLGVDLGFDDSDAIVVIGFNDKHRETYLVEEFKRSKMDITSLAEKIKHFKDKYNPYYMVIDGGALGKKINEELNQRHSLFLEPADKQNKFAFIELLNSDLRLGYTRIQKNSELAKEMQQLTYDEKEFTENKKFVEDSYLDNHLCDAFLYAWRYIYSYVWKAQPPELEVGSKEWEQRETDTMVQAAIDNVIKRNSDDKGDYGNDFNWNDSSW